MNVSLRRMRQVALLAAVGGSMMLGSYAASAAPTEVAAAPPPNASATVDTNLRITGLDGPNRLTITQVPGQNVFLVTDTAPIKALPGCGVVAVPNGLFGVQCRALVGSGGTPFRTFFVNAGGGADVVTNNAPAPMRADGGAGDDTLIGGAFGDILRDSNGSDVLRGNGGQDDLNTESNAAGGGKDVLDGGAELDILYAGPGNDTLLGGDGKDRLVGGLGADHMDAGTGSGDVVAYENRTQRHVIRLDGLPNDGHAPLSGPPDEGDNVMPSAEIVQGSRGPDTMIGNNDPNIFEGFDGADVLIGMKGADDLRGGLGNDTLASNDLFGVPVADGAIDKLDGFDGTDSCRVPFVSVEADITISCEIINQD